MLPNFVLHNDEQYHENERIVTSGFKICAILLISKTITDKLGNETANQRIMNFVINSNMLS